MIVAFIAFVSFNKSIYLRVIMKALMLCLLLLIGISVNAEVASWYGNQFHGRKTASGEVFRTQKLTCASNVHKMGTMLLVTNKVNGKSVVVKVNDRGGFGKYGRTLDLSQGAFSKIANTSQGVAKVTIKKL